MSKYTMEGIFFIMQGNYQASKKPMITRGDKSIFIGGFDPYNDETADWFYLIERHSYKCLSCGDYDQMMSAVEKFIKRNKGSLDKFLKEISAVRPPIPQFKWICQEVEKRWGEYFQEDIEYIELFAFEDLDKEAAKNKKVFRRPNKTLVTTH